MRISISLIVIVLFCFVANGVANDHIRAVPLGSNYIINDMQAGQRKGSPGVYLGGLTADYESEGFFGFVDLYKGKFQKFSFDSGSSDDTSVLQLDAPSFLGWTMGGLPSACLHSIA